MLNCVRVPILCLLISAAMVFAAVADIPFSFEATPGQLPKSVVPRNYSIRIQPDLEKFTTRGTETIEIEVLQPVSELVLNALAMDITQATIITPDEISLKPVLNEARQNVSLLLPRELPPGKYRLSFEFSGKIGEQAQGLFYVRYPTPSGQKVMLGTQMEATEARRMFPCWDEPVFRATFDLTVVLPQKHKAFSNMPVEKEWSLADGLKEIKFNRTPAMPSYLIALVTGELEALTAEAEGVQIRVITTEGKKQQGLFALDATANLLAYYNKYFGIKYPLPKLDQIAIPGGFEGAMENWGAITYNESVLLFDPTTSSPQTKQEIFVTVAHEMSHQWFGDLVTMAWWDNLWLNEGFATWMENKATDHFHPDWQMWLAFSGQLNGVMSGDARSSTHPIQRRVENESQANDAFDSVTYQKGGAFLRMLECFLGEDTFRQGVQQYLEAHRFSNTTSADLWTALEAVSGRPIKTIAAGWTEQLGFPIVKAKSQCVNNRQMIWLEQERFTVEDPGARSLQWQIPVGIIDADHPSAVRYSLLEGTSTALTYRDCGHTLKLNAGGTGYYHVQYDSTLFDALQKGFNRLPAADRLNLLNDSVALMESGRGSVVDYLELAASLRDEENFAVWDQVLGTLEFLDELERGQPGRAAFRKYARGLMNPQLTRLGWKPKSSEPITDALLRNRVISLLGKFDDQAVIAKADALFKSFLTKPDSLAADLRPAVLRIVGRYADRKTYEQIHELARKAQSTEERQRFYRAMCGALDPELARATLELSLTEETVPQEATGLVPGVASGGEQPELSWEFAQQHIKKLLERLESFARNEYVPSIFASFSDAARADELEKYVVEHISPDALAKAKETAEAIRFKAALKKRELTLIDRWIAQH